ncbi:hypothetical protein GTA08_BOTSDO09783 [Neofusicoccum parvum]|nr:hypothetical protein GTA08_BOTSDO09783 [Neofusicoccum parvum]
MEPFSQLKLCLGGAGTHFPREEDRSNKDMPEASTNYMSNTRAVLASWGLRLTPDLEADLHYYEGIWYDSEDVAGYLEHLGVKMDAGGSLAKVETETLKIEGILPDQGQASRPVGTERHQYPPRTDSHGVDEDGGTTVAGVRPNVTIQMTNELGEEQWDRFCDFYTPWLMDPALFDTITMAPDGELSGQGEAPSMATIDLSILVNKLIKCSVCIGRGPGFRREDVNNALRAAVIEA